MVIALSVSAVAVWLGFWQYGRHVERADALADFEAATERPSESVFDIVPAGAIALPEGAEWRTVTATGRFKSESFTVLRTRPVLGTPAWQFLAWLESDDDRSFLVSLGWIPQPGPNEDPSMPELNANETVTITAVMRTWEPDDGKTAQDTVSRISPEQIEPAPGDPVPGYGMIRQWCDNAGCVNTPIGSEVPLPNLSTGPHLSYAWQWWLFAVMAPVGGVLLLRRDARMANGSLEPVPARELGNSKRTRQRKLTDEEIEDAL